MLRAWQQSGGRLGIGEQDAHEFFVGLVEKLTRCSTARAVRWAAAEPGLQDLLGPRLDRDRRIWAGCHTGRRPEHSEQPPAQPSASALPSASPPYGLEWGLGRADPDDHSDLPDLNLHGGEASPLPDPPRPPRSPPPSDDTGGPVRPSVCDVTPGPNPPPRGAQPPPPAWVTALVRGIVPLPDRSRRPWAASGTDTVSGVFTGYTGSSVICTECKQPTPLRLSPFQCLTLELPPGLRTTSAAQCLGRMTTPEPVHGYRCERCNKQTPCFKQTVIARRPAALCLWVGSRGPLPVGWGGVRVGSGLVVLIGLLNVPAASLVRIPRGGVPGKPLACVSSPGCGVSFGRAVRFLVAAPLQALQPAGIGQAKE